MFVGELPKTFFSMTGFLDKNRDTFSADLVDLVGESKFPFLLELFSKERAMVCTLCYCFISLLLLDNYLTIDSLCVSCVDFASVIINPNFLRVKIRGNVRQLLELSSRSLLIY